MGDSSHESMTLGPHLLAAAPRVFKQAQAFHAWIIESVETVQRKYITPVVEDGRVIAVVTPVGRFELFEELSRDGDELFARIVFFRAATPLGNKPEEVYSVRVYADGTARFGSAGLDQFEWDHNSDHWMARNILRIAYELAVAATRPRG